MTLLECDGNFQVWGLVGGSGSLSCVLGADFVPGPSLLLGCPEVVSNFSPSCPYTMMDDTFELVSQNKSFFS
jgi:hypothetical protein